MIAAPESPSTEVGQERPKTFGRPRVFAMAILSAIACYAGMLLAQGNGWSPSLFIIGGLVVGVVVERSFTRRSARWPRRLFRRVLVLCGVGLIGMGLARWSITIDSATAFADITGIAPPAGVSNIRAWRQWYDGPGIVIAFDADKAAIDAILRAGSRPYERRENWDRFSGWSEHEREQQFFFALSMPFFKLDRLARRPMVSPNFWSQMDAEGPKTVGRQLIWDSETKQAFASWLRS